MLPCHQPYKKIDGIAVVQLCGSRSAARLSDSQAARLLLQFGRAIRVNPFVTLLLRISSKEDRSEEFL